MRDPFSAVLTMTPREALDTLEQSLGIREEELAQALNSNRRSLQRWRAGTAHPQQLARQRLAELLRLQKRGRATFKGRGAARRWFHSESHYLGGITPAEAIRVMAYAGGAPGYRQRCEEVAANGYEGFDLE